MHKLTKPMNTTEAKTETITLQLSNRVINDIILALGSLDQFSDISVETEGTYKVQPRILQIDAETRLQLARNHESFAALESDMRLRHFELVRSLDPVTEEGVTRVPEKRMPEFRRLWSAILDEQKSVSICPVKFEGFRGGTNRMPIVLLAYLTNLVDPASLERRFASLTEAVTLTRRAAALLLGSLAGLEGKMVPVQDTNDANKTREAMLPWSFAPVVRENLAYNFFTLYRLGAEINQHRSTLFQSANASDPAMNTQIEAYLDEEVALRLIPVGAQDLNLKQNAIPLATLSGIKALLKG